MQILAYFKFYSPNSPEPTSFLLYASLLKAFSADSSNSSSAFLIVSSTILRDEIRKPYPKIRLDKRKGEAIDNLEQLRVVCPNEKDYLTDLLEVIKTYDDLSDGELKYLAKIAVRKNNATEVVEELKAKIPVHYIVQIKEKVESIDAQTEVIMFTEDLRNDIK